MNKVLSKIVADIFDKSKGGEELPSRIDRLRDEIKTIIESEDTVFGKFRGVMESFQEIIPDEKQRYNAAIKALSATSKISRQEIVKAVNGQLDELKILEKGLLSAPLGWRDDLKAMEARSREMKDEISKLREKIGRLESEEQEILKTIAVREKEMVLVEKAVGDLFTAIGAEIAVIKKKVEDLTAESAAARPIPNINPVESELPGGEKSGNGQKSPINESVTLQDTEFQKKCPMCGGRMDYHGSEKMWMCYSCAFELKEEPGSGGKKSENREPAAPQDTEFQKQCPMCGGRMNLHAQEELWMCYSCAYEEKAGEDQNNNEEKREQKIEFEIPPAAKPIPDQFLIRSNEELETRKGSSSGAQPSGKKKTCPVCRKKMNWFEMESTWRCPFCDYERKI